MLPILDEYTRECHVLRADRILKSGGRSGVDGIPLKYQVDPLTFDFRA